MMMMMRTTTTVEMAANDKGETLIFCCLWFLLCFSFFFRTTCLLFCRELKLEDYPSNNLRDTIMRFWINRRRKLVHNYSLVGYMLSPNPTIMADAARNKTQAHHDASEALITKLILDPSLVGGAKGVAKAELIDTFMEEYTDFVNRRGPFAKDNIWIIAAKPDCKAYRWHQKYSLQSTKVLGKLACLVLSKNLGIGKAERNWKQVKAVKSGQRSNTGIEKTKKQVLIYAQYQQARAETRIKQLSSAGKLWDDDDFKSMKMDEYCKEIRESVDGNNSNDPPAAPAQVRTLRMWRESWEKKKVGPRGDQILEARLMAKYSNLRLTDVDSNKVYTVHTMHFEKQRGKNAYFACAILDGFNHDLPAEHESNFDFYDNWEINDDFFDCVRKYYEGKESEVKMFDMFEIDSDNDEMN